MVPENARFTTSLTDLAKSEVKDPPIPAIKAYERGSIILTSTLSASTPQPLILKILWNMESTLSPRALSWLLFRSKTINEAGLATELVFGSKAEPTISSGKSLTIIEGERTRDACFFFMMALRVFS